MKKILNQLNSFYTPGFLWGFMVVVGIVLRLRQYFANRSLWIDEASLALNIVNRTFGELALPLDYDQGAPIGFLFIEKLVILILGNHDYTLRLFPVFSGALSVFLIYLIASEHFGKSGMFAVLLFSISPSMVYYSSELKQYSSDVMIALLLTYLSTLCLRQDPRARNFILLGIAGIFSIWVSHPSAFILAGIGLILIVEKLVKKVYSQIPWILGIGTMWGFTFLMTYVLSLRYLTRNQFLNDYWQNHYMPLPPWDHWGWYKSALVSLLININSNFSQTYLVGCFLLIIIGIVSLFFRSKATAFLVISPFLIASIASILHRYPLSGRFMHFLFPFVTLLMAEGLSRIYFICANLNRKAALLVYASLALIILRASLSTAFYNALTPPLGEDIKPVLAYIQANMEEDDTIYVHVGSVNPFVYYAPFYEFDTENIFIARDSKSVRRFTDDVKDHGGRYRIWFIFSHITGCDGCTGDRLQFHIQLLDKYGTQQDRFEASNAGAYLYTLDP